MANTFFPMGEIYDPIPFIDEQAASDLGERILLSSRPLSSNPCLSGLILRIEEGASEETKLLNDYECGILLSETDREVVDRVNEDFRNLLGDDWKVGSSFYLGAPSGGRWHIDASHDVRAIVNLSAFPIKLEVATKWDRRDYARASSKFDDFAFLRDSSGKKKKPEEIKVVESNPGEGVIINNMVRADRQVPHKASNPVGKVILRMFAIKKAVRYI